MDDFDQRIETICGLAQRPAEWNDLGLDDLVDVGQYLSNLTYTDTNAFDLKDNLCLIFHFLRLKGRVKVNECERTAAGNGI